MEGQPGDIFADHVAELRGMAAVYGRIDPHKPPLCGCNDQYHVTMCDLMQEVHAALDSAIAAVWDVRRAWLGEHPTTHGAARPATTTAALLELARNFTLDIGPASHAPRAGQDQDEKEGPKA